MIQIELSCPAKKPCPDCAAPITLTAARCRSCAKKHLYRDPAAREVMRQAKLRSYILHPEYREQLIAASRAALEKGRALALRKAGYSIKRLSWLPEDRRPEYERLRAKYGWQEATRILREDIAAQDRRAERERNREREEALREVRAHAQRMAEKHAREQAQAY